MASCIEVLSFLRTLTSSSLNTSPTDKNNEFDDVLLSNLERLRDALGEKGRFARLKERLESQVKPHVKKTCGAVFDESTEVCKKDSSIKDNHKKEFKPTKVDLTQSKYTLRLTYVKTCLELLKFLKESLIELKIESEDKKEQPKPGKRGNDAPPLPADALSVGDQKTVLTAIQFVAVLGICPNLLPGVGIPIEKRSGFASALNIHCNIRSERCLFECVDTLVECIAQPSLGSLVLSRHLGDILSGLLQICYAPVSAYSNYDKSDNNNSENVNKDCGASTSSTLSCHSIDSADIGCKTRNSKENLKSEAESSVRGDSSVPTYPSDVYKCTHESLNNKNDDDGLLITSFERERCVCNLQKILDRVYQPIVIRELLVLQGGQTGTGKRPTTDNSGRTSVSTCRENKRADQGMKCSVSPSQTPKWMRNVCGQLLSERLMKPNGVKAVLHGFLEGLAGSADSPDWQKCDVVAKVIANCPSQAESVEQYYKLVSPQVLQLLHEQSAGAGRLFIRAASSITRQMLEQYPELAQKYILSLMLQPLAKTSEEGDFDDMFISELAVMRCVEDIHKVFVVGTHNDVLRFLLPIVHPVFELFCFTRKGVSHLRSALQEILVHILKHTEPHAALTMLYTLAFKKSALQNFTPTKSSTDPNTDDKDDKENIAINVMSDTFAFAHGDNGGVIIKCTNNDADKNSSADGILKDLQGGGLNDSEVRALCIVELLSGLKKDSVAGDFFIYLVQELTNLISNFSEDMHSASGTRQSLLILHLVALMCEKLGPSILKNTSQTLSFIQSTLKRACTILQADDEGLGTAFLTETLTMSLGMLSAVLGGAVEIKKEDRPLVEDLLPLLKKLAEEHPSVEVQDMASDLRIAIATHGAVWSHKINDAAKNLRKQTDAVQVDSVSVGKESATSNSKGKQSTNPTEESSPQASSEFDEAFTQLCDPFLPVRGHAMIKLASLIRHRDPKAVESTDTLLKIFLEQLTHDDSYIYLAAIQGLVSLADIKADTVIPRLTREFATCRKEAADIAAGSKEVKGKGYYIPSDKVTPESTQPSRSPELRMKLGEAVVKATRNCGELVPRYSQYLLSALLMGVKDPEPLVRASSLSNLGDVCQLLRFSLGLVVNEIFSCVSAVLKTDKSEEVRRAAVLVITLLLRGLGQNVMEVLSSTLKDIYQLLKLVESTDIDHVTRVHAQTALGELDSITREYLFPKPTYTKHIQVLP